MKTVLSFLICVSLFATTYAIPSEPGEIVMMRVYESLGKTSRIVVTYETGQQEVIELEPVPKGIESNAATISTTIIDISKKGYKLFSVSGGDYLTAYIFVKE